jgi:soluble lytic murein transglycosylase-like protein
MSIEAASARIAALQELIGRAQGLPAEPAPTPGFAAQLQSAVATSAPAQGGTPFSAEIDAAAARNGVDPALLKALIRQESDFDPSARSGAGAMGLTQLMPGTAASLGVTNPFDPVQAIEGGARYLRAQLDRFGGDPAKALAAYNAGPGAVARFGGVPPYAETQNYVRRVLAYADEYRSAGAATPVSVTPATFNALPGLTYSTV